MSFLGLLKTLERMTRPLSHDDDRPDMCEVCDLPVGHAGEHWTGAGEIDMPIIRTRPWGTDIKEDVPGQEPRLSDDELVAVRNLMTAADGTSFARLRKMTAAPTFTLDDVVAQLAQLTYLVEDIRNLLAALIGEPGPAAVSDVPRSPAAGHSALPFNPKR